MNLPRFVWVTEIASTDDFSNKVADGLIILDATEPTFDNEVPLLLSLHYDTGRIYRDGKFKHLTLSHSLLLESYNKNIF